MVSAADALPGRPTRSRPPRNTCLSGRPLKAPVPEGMAEAMFGMGCFWGVERIFWQTPGVWLTMAGYAGGHTPNPTYQEVCTGRTGHNEVVRVIFDPAVVSYDELLRIFWEGHDPTQGMRQGNDTGTQYRSGIYAYSTTPRRPPPRSAATPMLQEAAECGGLRADHHRDRAAPTFYFAEDYHQQYLAKNPGGYCGIGGTGVTCPVGLTA
jgi:peptide-methionine (S)-S-oxide reductase